MKLPKSEHLSQPWRIHEFTRDFRIEDVWALPTPGGPADFPHLLELVTAAGPGRRRFSVVGLLFAVREALGRVLGWDGDEAANDPRRPSLRTRLPQDLRGAASTVTPGMGFTPLYQLDDEWAAELVNRTVHGVIHLGWVPDRAGGYRGQMAILVKPNGVLGHAYMAAISPFRYLVVYPRMLTEMGRKWSSRTASQAQAVTGHEGA